MSEREGTSAAGAGPARGRMESGLYVEVRSKRHSPRARVGRGICTAGAYQTHRAQHEAGAPAVFGSARLPRGIAPPLAFRDWPPSTAIGTPPRARPLGRWTCTPGSSAAAGRRRQRQTGGGARCTTPRSSPRPIPARRSDSRVPGRGARGPRRRRAREKGEPNCMPRPRSGSCSIHSSGSGCTYRFTPCRAPKSLHAFSFPSPSPASARPAQGARPRPRGSRVPLLRMFSQLFSQRVPARSCNIHNISPAMCPVSTGAVVALAQPSASQHALVSIQSPGLRARTLVQPRCGRKSPRLTRPRAFARSRLASARSFALPNRCQWNCGQRPSLAPLPLAPRGARAVEQVCECAYVAASTPPLPSLDLRRWPRTSERREHPARTPHPRPTLAHG